MALTGDVIRNALKDIDKSEDFAEKLAKAITDNLEIKVPVGTVIETVTGGSGLPAVGLPNKTPIKCEVK